MECLFVYDDMGYNAQILDLSLEGAFLSSTFLPALQSKVLIMPVTDFLKTPLTLKGTIRHSVCAESEFGKVIKYGIEFEDPPLALLRLISAMSKTEPEV
jgi:hypothetical protein